MDIDAIRRLLGAYGHLRYTATFYSLNYLAWKSRPRGYCLDTCLDAVNGYNPVATCLGRREQRLERLECMTLEALNLGGVMSTSED